MPIRILSALVLLAVTLCSATISAADAGALTLVEKGVRIPVAGLGEVVLPWPSYAKPGSDDKLKPQSQKIEGKKAAVTYADGTVLTVTIAGDQVELSASKAPAGYTVITAVMILPPTIRNGGHWKIGDKAGDFPADKPSTPHLYQGNETVTIFTKPGMQTLRITVPQYSYLQITDNREWKWDAYSWMFNSPVSADHLRQTLTFHREAAAH